MTLLEIENSFTEDFLEFEETDFFNKEVIIDSFIKNSIFSYILTKSYI